MTAGYIYVLRNPYLRDLDGTELLKVGGTARMPFQRAAELSASTGVPGRFTVVLQHTTANWVLLEKQLHRELLPCRVTKEFFKAPASRIAAAVQRHEEMLDRRACDVTQGPRLRQDTRELVVLSREPGVVHFMYDGSVPGLIYVDTGELVVQGRIRSLEWILPRMRGFDGSEEAKRAREDFQLGAAATILKENAGALLLMPK